VTEGWAAALHAAAAAPVTLVIGANDTGKSTLVGRLAGALAARGHAVAVVDADLGQSDVGPPTTIGLGRVRGPLARLADAEVLGLEFLGVTSPATCPGATADATARLVRRARAAGFERVVVDTSGLVEGALGRALKRLKLERVAPDTLLVLQRAGECEPILDALRAPARPRVVRLPAVAPGRRSPAVRRHARGRALDAHLAGAAPVTLDLADVTVRPAPGARGLTLADAAGALVALDDREGRTLGLGWITAIDLDAAQLTVQTVVDATQVAGVVIGRERYRIAG
jgi:polynucleotide 5'-hydroxyl-kinase GRC3/NOL9